MMASIEDRVAALEAKVEQLHLFDQMTSRIVEVIQQTGREAMRAIADLGEQFDHMNTRVGTLETDVSELKVHMASLDEKFDTHTVLLHRILKRLGDEE
jgi:histidinol dehydrogenase